MKPVTIADIRALVVTLREQHKEQSRQQRAKCDPAHPDYHATLVDTREAFAAIHGLATIDLGMVLSSIDALAEQQGGRAS